ncbi:MAG TPA: efflux RND transporter periplasmic adaptor subunit [Candidatus Cybelea sp.]|nr:efflux RND transporter periplasmic adaptor subunit [Candidatus Cybelea sp.]
MTSRAWMLLSAVVLVTATALLWLGWGRRPVPAPTQAAGPQVSLTTVRKGVVEETISLNGRIGSPAGTQAKLAFAVAGSVQSVDVTLGQRVAAGASLARIDPTSYSLAAAQAQSEANAAGRGAALAAVDRTSVTVRRDEIELQRQQRLFAAGIVAKRDVEAARATLWSDRAQVQTARISLAQAQDQSRAASLHAADARYDVDRTTLRAPFAGTVTGILVTRGESVDPATPAIALSSEAQESATLEVPAADLARIAPGNPVRARSGSITWRGRVAGVASAVDPATGFAVASVTGVPTSLPAGTPVDAAVVTRSLRGLVVPRDAVVEDPQTGNALVFVRNGSRFDTRRVSVAGKDDRFALVSSGLREGEPVAASGAVDLLSPSGP